jgi:hypothetical protein
VIIRIAGPLVPLFSPLERRIAIPELRKYKSPVNDHISAGSFQAERETLRFEIQKLIISVWNKEELPQK